MINKLPRRLASLKADLIAMIPCAPEEERLKAELAAKPLDRVLVHYLTWVDRLIAPRPRNVIFSEDFWKTPMPDDVLGAVYTLHRKAVAGDDLSPYLSRFSRTHGYTGSPEERRKAPSWADGGKATKISRSTSMKLTISTLSR